MKQVILFVGTEAASIHINNIKKDVIAFLGTRMICAFLEEGIPMIGLCEKLSDYDKNEIVKIAADYSDEVITIVLHEKEVGNLDKNKKLMEFIQYEEPVVL